MDVASLPPEAQDYAAPGVDFLPALNAAMQTAARL